jgi:hypothetical protein
MKKNQNVEIETSVESAVETADVETVSVKIGDMVATLPVRYVAGHVLTDTEATVLDTAIRRQFRSKWDSALKNWKSKDDGTEFATIDEITADYENYLPGVYNNKVESVETLHREAGLRTLNELVAEHNAAIVAGLPGHFNSPNEVILPKANRKLGITAASAREAIDKLVTSILASEKHAERVQRHLSVIQNEQNSGSPAVNAVLSADSLI